MPSILKIPGYKNQHRIHTTQKIFWTPAWVIAADLRLARCLY